MARGVVIKSAEDIGKSRQAAQLAAEVLSMIAPLLGFPLVGAWLD
jgi:hypothetical protein